jgi:TrpR-related protein YerC/YecD
LSESGFRAQGLALLTRVVAAARTPEELESLLTEVWTPGELRDAAQRVEVAAQLLEGNTYEAIAQQTGASTATISRVRRSLERGGGMLERTLQRVGRAGVHYARRHWASGGIID